MGRLDGKVAVITGAGSGMGRATAILMGSEGAKVVVADWIAEGGEETARRIKKAGGEATFVKADVSKATEVDNMMKTAIRSFGQLDILFNNAGISHRLASTVDIQEEVWDKVMSVNLKGVFLGMKYGIPYMLERGGSIINTASTSSLYGLPYLPAYSASKGGVYALTRTTALEYADKKIRINCIIPGPISTPILQQGRSGPEYEALKPFRTPVPMGRIGMPEEVARVVLFLASDDASFVTGAAWTIDGGNTVF